MFFLLTFLDHNEVSKREQDTHKLIDKMLKSSERNLQESNRMVHNEIMEMSRAIRRQMKELKCSNKNDYGL